jgi:hypothetical protein
MEPTFITRALDWQCHQIARFDHELASLDLQGPLSRTGELIIYVGVASDVRTQHTVTEKRAMTGGGTIE